MCEGKDKYVWLATCMCELTVYKFRYSTFTLWLIYVCVCDVMWWYTCCEAVLGRVWSVARKKSLPLSLSFCLSPIGWRVWKWNVILRVKHQTASSCWAVRSPTGQRMDHGPPVCLSVCVCMCLCVSGCTHTLACVHFVSVSVCWRGLSFSFACLWHVLYERFLILSWSFIPMMPFNFVCAHMHKFACAQSVNPTCVCVTMIYPCHHHIAYVCSQTEANC